MVEAGSKQHYILPMDLDDDGDNVFITASLANG